MRPKVILISLRPEPWLSVLLIPAGVTWQYDDTVTSEVPGWTDPSFDDSTWPSGPAELGNGDAPDRPEVTVLATVLIPTADISPRNYCTRGPESSPVL